MKAINAALWAATDRVVQECVTEARRIWKYGLDVVDEQLIEMPAGACLLSVQEQRGYLQVWALVDTTAATVARRILIFGTGHPIPDDVQAEHFVGTFQAMQGSLVFHVFDGGVA